MKTNSQPHRLTAYISIVAFDTVGLTFAGAAWDRPAVEVKAGEELSVQCTVSGLEFLDVVRVVHATDDRTLTIVDSSNVKAPFTRLPRYKIYYDYDDGSGNGTVRLNYRGESSFSVFIFLHYHCKKTVGLRACQYAF